MLQPRMSLCTYLDALLCQITAIFRSHIHHHQSITQSFDGALYTNNPTGALCGYIQVVSDGTSSDLQNIVWSTVIQENPTESREKCPWRTATNVYMKKSC